jgi:UDP-glucose:(heptosyl)LPS alpha-1,3-glucosyltransferase
MRPLRIALVRQRYRDDGGAERFISRAIEALDRDDIELTLIARKWSGTGNARTLRCNPFYLGRLWRDASFARCVCQSQNHENFDLVQSHERLTCCDLYRAGDGVHREWLRQRSRVLPAFRAIMLWANPYHRYVMATERSMFQSPSLKAVICNSKMVQDEILGYFDIPKEKLHVIYSGVDTERFHPRLKNHRKAVRESLSIKDDQSLFLFVGSGFERKGAAALIKALARLPNTAHGVIVGEDKHRQKYEALANRLGLSKQIHFLGKQSDVGPYYGAADAMVLPTLYDPFPNVILEAMACGLPVITSTKSGGAEFIRQGENGYVRDALDIEGISHAMRELMDPAIATRQGESARNTVEPYHLESMGKAMADLYQTLLSNYD